MRAIAEAMKECDGLESKGDDEYSATRHLPDDNQLVYKRWNIVKHMPDKKKLFDDPELDELVKLGRKAQNGNA